MRYEKLFSVSSWSAFWNFKWPGSSQSLLSFCKMKAYMMVGGRGHFTPGQIVPPPPPPLHSPPPQANTDNVHRDKIGENVSSILLKGFLKLQITRLFSIPFIMTQKWKSTGELRGGAHYPGLECPPPLLPNSEVVTEDRIEKANLMLCNKN